MDQYSLFARVLEAFTNNKLPTLINELLALEAEEEEEAAAAALFESSTPTVVDEEAGLWYPYHFTLPSMLEEEVPDVEVLPTVAPAAYNTMPSMLEEEVLDVQILPTVAPAAPTVTSAAPTAIAACFAQQALPISPPNKAIHNVKHTIRASGGATKRALPYAYLPASGGATKRAFLLAYLHKLQEVLSAQTNQAWPTFLDQSRPKRPPSKPLTQPKWAYFLTQLGLTKPPSSKALTRVTVVARL